MKSYTAIYDTKAMKGIHYSFKAENLEKAIIFCKYKFSKEIKNLVII